MRCSRTSTGMLPSVSCPICRRPPPVFRQLTRFDALTDDTTNYHALVVLAKAAARDAALDVRQFAGDSLRAGP